MVEKDFEIIDGKKVPLRHFILDLDSQELGLLCICIAESFLFNAINKTEDKEILLEKIDIFNRFAGVMGVEGVDPTLVEMLKEKIRGIQGEKSE